MQQEHPKKPNNPRGPMGPYELKGLRALLDRRLQSTLLHYETVPYCIVLFMHAILRCTLLQKLASQTGGSNQAYDSCPKMQTPKLFREVPIESKTKGAMLPSKARSKDYYRDPTSMQHSLLGSF